MGINILSSAKTIAVLFSSLEFIEFNILPTNLICPTFFGVPIRLIFFVFKYSFPTILILFLL